MVGPLPAAPRCVCTALLSSLGHLASSLTASGLGGQRGTLTSAPRSRLEAQVMDRAPGEGHTCPASLSMVLRTISNLHAGFSVGRGLRTVDQGLLEAPPGECEWGSVQRASASPALTSSPGYPCASQHSPGVSQPPSHSTPIPALVLDAGSGPPPSSREALLTLVPCPPCWESWWSTSVTPRAGGQGTSPQRPQDQGQEALD